MKKPLLLLYTLLSTAFAFSQEGFLDDGKGGCKTFSHITANRRNPWTGDCADGYAVGKGTLKVFQHKTLIYTYVGEMLNGNSEGEGTYTWMNGMEYSGQMRKNKKEGQGALTWPNGQKYVGQFKNEQYDGEGTFTWPDGKIYTGQWKDNKKVGQGSLTWPNGQKYVGQFKNEQYDGEGTYTWPDGRIYTGQWKNNRKVGQGTYTWPDGHQYVGEWKGDKREGQGTSTWLNGRKYVGQWKGDKQEGQGTFTLPDGTEYVGQWKNGKYEGEGMLTWPDGQKYVGQWQDNKYEGQGILYSSNGCVEKDGYWSDNNFMGADLTEAQKKALKSAANRRQVRAKSDKAKNKTCSVRLEKEETEMLNDKHGHFYTYQVKVSARKKNFKLGEVETTSICGTKTTHNLYHIERNGSKRLMGECETQEEAFGKMIAHCGCDTWVKE